MINISNKIIRVSKDGVRLKRISADIPIETYLKIKNYNKVSVRPLNITKVVQNALMLEASKIDEEALIQHEQKEQKKI